MIKTNTSGDVMSGIVNKEFFGMKNENDEDEPNDNSGLVSSPTRSMVSEDRDELVCSVSPSGTSSEILLYVDNQNDGVHDLIRVALNQSMSTEELQQQLQEAGSNITLQNLDTSHHTVISLDKDRSGRTDKTALIRSTSPVRRSGDGTSTNIFQLPSLNDALMSVREQGHGFMGSDLDIGGIKSESLEDEVEGSSIEDYIIANVNTRQSENTPGELEVGNIFYSLDEVEDALRLYEESHSVKLYKRDVRSLEALMKRSLKLQKLDKINESLKYGQLLYCCVYGGKRRAQKLACVDECGVARYTDCKMFIRFAISDDGMKLVVNGKLESHNHEEVVADDQYAEPVYITNTGNADDIHLGAGFVDLEELYKAIHKYETDNHVHLWRRDGRTVEALAKRAPGTARKIMETNPGLRFAELRFCCSYGGRQIAEDKKEKMRATNSFKQGCEMHIRFGVSDDGSQLVVKSMSEEHNHEINEETIVKEALHPELCSYVSKLVWSDINIGIDEVKRRLEHYVFDEMFKDKTPPPRTRRQYFPSKKQIRYFMAKAKSSLNISQEAELKLEAQAEKLKESRGDEKMIFNFKVSHSEMIPSELTINNEESVGDADDEFFPSTNSAHETQACESQLVNEVRNAKILFCHQTPHQQRLLRRYFSQFILTQINDIHSKIPFPLFCLYVQTNVDFQLVGEFILQANTSSMIMEGLQTFKEWNPGWSPKFVIVDFSEEQINAVENIFPGTFVLISDTSREKAWLDWLSSEENEVLGHKDEITSYLQAIANSHSEDALNGAARELEESDIWKISDKLRNWFQINWLSQAKRWVAGYRPDDYLLIQHNGRTLEMELRVFKSIKLVNKSAPLQDVIQQIVEHVAPVALKQYELLNQESIKLQIQLRYMYSDIPNYLACRPGKLTYHVYERVKLACEQSYTLSYVHPGIFTVQCSGGEDDMLHTVSFGDSNSFPSCDCYDWQLYKLPCVHLCAVFNSYPGWTWDMLSVAYKSSPVLNVDWSIIPDRIEDLPGNIVDKSTQTSDATLISNSPQLSNMSDSRRLTETPQVLASQCRGLLQQLSKLQLAHHNRDNLYRLKSELKELISLFSNATKQKFLSSISFNDTYVLHSKGPGRPRKMTPTEFQSEGAQSVFEQYNVTPVTPRQVNDFKERKIYPSRNRTSSSQLVISKPATEPSESQEHENNILGTVYIVDPTRLLVSAKDKNESQNITHNQLHTVANNQEQSVLKLKSNPPIVRKRIRSPSVFLKPPDKRIKDDVMEQDPNFDSEVPLEFSQENVDDGSIHDNSLHGGLHSDALLTVDEDSSISAVINDQTIDIQLEKVSVPIGDTEDIDKDSVDSRSIHSTKLEINSLKTPSSTINTIVTPSVGTGDIPSNSVSAVCAPLTAVTPDSIENPASPIELSNTIVLEEESENNESTSNQGVT